MEQFGLFFPSLPAFDFFPMRMPFPCTSCWVRRVSSRPIGPGQAPLGKKTMYDSDRLPQTNGSGSERRSALTKNEIGHFSTGQMSLSFGHN
jgi:hypothetical protein